MCVGCSATDTQDHRDLVGVYDYLLGNETCDPFEDSGEAVAAFEAAEWLPLLAGRFVPKSDFSMKNLQPPES